MRRPKGLTSMRTALIVSVLLFVPGPVRPQAPSRADIVQQFCHASEVTSGPEFQRMAAIRARLDPVLSRVQGHEIHLAVVDSNVINAWENDIGPRAA